MIVRTAVLDDVSRLSDLGEIFYLSTILPQFADYDRDSISALLIGCIESDMSIVLVMETDGIIVGGFTGMVIPLYWNVGVLAAQQIAWFVHPDHRGPKSLKLLSTFEKWAEDMGATIFFSGAKTDPALLGMDAVLRRKGYEQLERIYVKGVR